MKAHSLVIPIAIIAILGCVPASDACPGPSTLNVNMSVTRTKVGPAAAGVTQQDYWNEYPSIVGALKWSDGTTLSGAAFSVGCLFDACDAYSCLATGDDMYDEYYRGNSSWSGSCGSGGIQAQFTGLPDGYYDIYVYGHGPGAAQNTSFRTWNGYIYSDYQGTANSDFAATSAQWQEGQQYVVFRNQQVIDGFIAIDGMPLDDLDGWTYINGVQLVRATCPILNVNMSVNRTKVGPAAVGVTQQDYWNECTGVVSPLKWSDGTTLSGAAFSVGCLFDAVCPSGQPCYSCLATGDDMYDEYYRGNSSYSGPCGVRRYPITVHGPA